MSDSDLPAMAVHIDLAVAQTERTRAQALPCWTLKPPISLPPASGLYVDTQGQVMIFNTDLRFDLAGTMGRDENATGYATSVEVGKPFAFAGPWAVTPQAQLSYASVDGHFVDNFGAAVRIDDGDSLIGRLGLAIDYRSGWFGPRGPSSALVYGIANVYREFLDGTTVALAGTPLHVENEELWGRWAPRHLLLGR